ncbi:MAG: hypothetical protein JSS29_03775 [Proteobacteria bacterium]|nr:hypothetical protein [Pseudomonadota bacterium]
MGNVAIAFYVVGALLTVYIVAAGWRPADRSQAPERRVRPGEIPARTFDRRAVHWWRSRRLPRTP